MGRPGSRRPLRPRSRLNLLPRRAPPGTPPATGEVIFRCIAFGRGTGCHGRAYDRNFIPMTTAAIRRLAIPTPVELIDRARSMVPEIRALAEETERNRNVFQHIIDKIRDAELLRTSRPKEFGGFEYDGEVALKIALTISAACASTGWAVNGAVSNGRSIAHFPIEAQREVWDGDQDPFTCACFAPTGDAIPVEGGYVLSGSWSFASGCDASSWVKLGAFI